MAQYLSEPRIEGPIWLEPDDISLLQTRLSEAETHLEALEKQISELMRQKDAKLVEVTSLRNLLSPIRRIPVEILSEIFELSCLPDGNLTADYDIIRYTSMVSRVCVAWRKAAYATPRMWSKLCLSLYSHQKVFSGDIELIKEWMARSQGLPLELHLDMIIWNSENLGHRESQFLDGILAFHRQTRLISLSGLSNAFIPLLQLSRSSFPALEKLFLRAGGMENIQYLSDFSPRGILDAPRLQHVSVEDAADGSILGVLVLPLDQLTSLEIILDRAIGLFDMSIYQGALCRCNALVSLTVDITDEAGFDVNLSICLPALKFLDIFCRSFMGSGNKVNLLYGLTTPLLEDLTLRWIDQDIEELASDVIGLQDRSTTSLSSLTLTLHCRMGHDGEYITQNLLLILAAFPAVKSLRIDQDWSHDDDTDDPVYDVDALVRAMIYTKGHPVLLPKLTNAELSIGDPPLDTSMELTSIKPMIHSRWWPDKLESEFDDDICRLQKVVLRGPSTRMKISREDFELLGLIVDFETVH